MTTTRRRLGTPTHEALGLTANDLLSMYTVMRLARALAERMWLLQRGGKTPFAVTAEGHEGVQVASAWALDRGRDFVLPYYRDLGVVLAMGMSAKEVMLNTLGRAADPNGGGRQLPGHWFHAGLNIVSGSSPVATQIPHAAGIALASKLRGEETVTAVYFGDGATSAGDFHEGLNFAGVHRLPVVFICENNGYAISVPSSKQAAVEDLAVRAAGYGFPGVTVDGNDALAVYRVTREAVERARAGEGPTFIEAKTYRLAPHTSADDDRLYRSSEEVEAWRRRDPIERLRAYLIEWDLLDKRKDEAIGATVVDEVEEAVRLAEASPEPEPESALQHVFYEKG